LRGVNTLPPTTQRDLYPELGPFDSGTLAVDGRHRVHYEQSGNPRGAPVLFVHGGPGGGTEPKHRRYFDPRHYRIVLFDQRGCGQSTPHADLVDNTTWHLVGDMERLREHLGIERWQLFGGSWGSTLALAYAQTHPQRVSALVLRGIFLLRRAELLWFYQQGASWLFPDAFEDFVAPIPPAERGDLISAYHKRLTGLDAEERLACAQAWSIWEGRTSRLLVDADLVAKTADAHFALAFARIECHYFVNRGFLRSDTQLLEDVSKIRHLPCKIVQGRYDVVCPAASAWALHRAWPGSELLLVPDAGHSASEAGIVAGLVAATDAFRALR
jgi:proline iminopeptidase